METSGDRLRKARLAKGFKSARSAAIRHGWVPSTYASHENGQTPVPVDDAKGYARAYGVTAAWILTADETAMPRQGQRATRHQVPVLGKVGAGAKINSFDDDNGRLGYAELPTADDNLGCVIVEGDSQYPRHLEGERLFYPQDHFAPGDLIGRECVVRLMNGQMLIKIIRRGNKKSTFHLESWNAPLMEDQLIEWASPVVWKG